jgi:iron complex outermembrane receptor protein
VGPSVVLSISKTVGVIQMSFRHVILRNLRIICVMAAILPYLSYAEAADLATQNSENSSGLEEITVTARRHSENLQTVPVTVSVVNADTLAFRGGNIDDLTQLVTGLENNAYSDRSNISFAIRGQQQSYGTLYPAVVTYFAEMPLSRVSDGQSFDIDSVQVLKGPQGTLFGRLTDGGAILLNPKKPTNDFDAYAEVKVGNYDQREYLGAANIPIVSDELMMRVAFDVNRRDGFTYNQFNGTRLDNVSYEAGRIGIAWKITDQIENYAVVNYNHSFTNGTATTLLQVNPIALTSAGFSNFIGPFQDALSRQNVLGPRTVDIGYSGPLNAGNPNSSDGIYYKRSVVWAVDTTTWHAADNFTLKSILGYVYNKEIENDDADGSKINYLQSLSSIP